MARGAIEKTIPEILAETVVRHGEREAVVFPKLGLRLTWREFAEQVDDAARGLLAIGLGKGDHVALWATNVPQWVILQFATARIGAVLVNINPAYRARELKYVLAQCDAKALFLIDRFKTSDYVAMLAEACPELLTSSAEDFHCAPYPKLRSIVMLRGETPPAAIGWEEMLERGQQIPRARLDELTATLSPGEAINIQYTSGTTGLPKAATLSHRNVVTNAYYVGACQRMNERDRICIPVPFYHCFGCVLGTLCAAVYGAAMIVPGEFFHARDTLDALESERATALYGVPTMFISQLQDATFAARDLSALRTGIMSGSPCPIEVMRRVVSQMGASEITIAYGQTEASPVVTQTRVDDPLELRVETVGRPLPGVEVKIVDPASGAELGDNQQGELCSRGHQVMLGYYNHPEATREAIDGDGWLHSGDLAVRLANGYYRITGRIKDMVIRGGENIYPREIEEFLFTHPAIQQAAVVGVPDAKYGEELCAWIQLVEGASVSEEEIRDFCREHLSHFKTPKYVRFVNQFPQTVTGKIQKFKIREQMAEELGIRDQETA